MWSVSLKTISPSSRSSGSHTFPTQMLAARSRWARSAAVIGTASTAARVPRSSRRIRSCTSVQTPRYARCHGGRRSPPVPWPWRRHCSLRPNALLVAESFVLPQPIGRLRDESPQGLDVELGKPVPYVLQKDRRRDRLDSRLSCKGRPVIRLQAAVLQGALQQHPVLIQRRLVSV